MKIKKNEVGFYILFIWATYYFITVFIFMPSIVIKLFQEGIGDDFLTVTYGLASFPLAVVQLIASVQLFKFKNWARIALVCIYAYYAVVPLYLIILQFTYLSAYGKYAINASTFYNLFINLGFLSYLNHKKIKSMMIGRSSAVSQENG